MTHYRMSDGSIYEVFPVLSGKGKTKIQHYEMRCIESHTKTTGKSFIVDLDHLEKLEKRFGLIQKI